MLDACCVMLGYFFWEGRGLGCHKCLVNMPVWTFGCVALVGALGWNCLFVTSPWRDVFWFFFAGGV